MVSGVLLWASLGHLGGTVVIGGSGAPVVTSMPQYPGSQVEGEQLVTGALGDHETLNLVAGAPVDSVYGFYDQQLQGPPWAIDSHDAATMVLTFHRTDRSGHGRVAVVDDHRGAAHVTLTWDG